MQTVKKDWVLLCWTVGSFCPEVTHWVCWPCSNLQSFFKVSGWPLRKARGKIPAFLRKTKQKLPPEPLGSCTLHISHRVTALRKNKRHRVLKRPGTQTPKVPFHPASSDAELYHHLPPVTPVLLPEWLPPTFCLYVFAHCRRGVTYDGVDMWWWKLL